MAFAAGHGSRQRLLIAATLALAKHTGLRMTPWLNLLNHRRRHRFELGIKDFNPLPYHLAMPPFGTGVPIRGSYQPQPLSLR